MYEKNNTVKAGKKSRNKTFINVKNKTGLKYSGLKNPRCTERCVRHWSSLLLQKTNVWQMDAIYIKRFTECLTSMSVQPQELLQILLLAYVVWYVRKVRGNIFQNIVFKCPLIKL